MNDLEKFDANIPEPEKEKYPIGMDFNNEIIRDCERKIGMLEAFSIAYVLQHSGDRFHADLSDTNWHKADAAVQNYETVKDLLERKVLPENARWYRDLVANMDVLGILYKGAKFDPDFEKKAAKGAERLIDLDEAWRQFLIRENVHDKTIDMSGQEIDALHERFLEEYRKNKQS